MSPSHTNGTGVKSGADGVSTWRSDALLLEQLARPFVLSVICHASTATTLVIQPTAHQSVEAIMRVYEPTVAFLNAAERLHQVKYWSKRVFKTARRPRTAVWLEHDLFLLISADCYEAHSQSQSISQRPCSHCWQERNKGNGKVATRKGFVVNIFFQQCSTLTCTSSDVQVFLKNGYSSKRLLQNHLVHTTPLQLI